jgi:hypothetical protein
MYCGATRPNIPMLPCPGPSEAKLYFYTAFGGVAAFAQGIVRLQQQVGLHLHS